MTGSGLPTMLSARRPAASSTAASTAPVPGHGPSGMGNVRSRLRPISSAPRMTAWVPIFSSPEWRSSCPATTTRSAREANSVLLTIRMPAAATWSTTAWAPITNAAPRSWRLASTNCSAAPDVTTSWAPAWNPRRQSLRTYSSGACRALLVRNAMPLPAARSAATASGAPSAARSPTQRQPSRSSRTWS